VADSADTPGNPDAAAPAAAKPVRGRGLRDSFGVLGIRDFRLLLIANALTFAGFQVRNMAQAWLVLDLTESSLWVGIVNAMPGIAIILVSLYAGAVVDRSERRGILVRSRFVIAVLSCLTAFLVTTGHIQVWHLIPIGLAMGVMFAFNNPAGQALAMDVVGRDRLISAASINTTISNVAQIAGPAAGGVLLALGIDWAFYLLGALYGVSWLMSAMMHTRSEKSGQARNMVADIRAGVDYARNSPAIFSLLIISTSAIFTGIFQAVVPLYARNILEVGETGYGVMLAVQGVGSLVGSMALMVAGNIRQKGPMLLLSSLLTGGSIVLFAFSGLFALSLVAMFIMGAAFSIWFVMVPTIIQTSSAPEMRGRVMSIFFMVVLVFQLGWIVGGVLDTAIGTQAAGLISGIGGTTIVVLTYLRSRALRSVT